MKRFFIITSILSLILLITLGVLDQRLHTTVAPHGMVSFELAGTPERVTAIIEAWSSKQKDIAAFSLGLDYLFILVYASALGSAVILLANYLADYSRTFFLAGVAIAWAQLATALFDMLENYALLIELLGTHGSPWPMIAKYCALSKFTLVGFAVTYLLVGGGLSLFYKRGYR